MNKALGTISGLPYFPGVAVGMLQQGNHGDVAGRILMIEQREIALCQTMPAGFIVVDAAPFSHSMIALLGLGVPTVQISSEQARTLEQHRQIMIDGASGLITDDLTAFKPADQLLLINDTGQAVLMGDGESVNLFASVRQSSIARQARELGAKAIGLVRTEFLLPEHGQVPDKAFYRRVFREICEAAAPLAVTFRLLDVAADKMPPWMAGKSHIIAAGSMQGVRSYNSEPVASVIEAQLEVLAELSNSYSISVLLPFLVRLEEYDYWLHQLRTRLPAAVPVGAMAETPAMVLDIARLTGYADFVAIGCNDLMQNIFAADRDQPDLRYYLDPYAPLLYRLLNQVAEQAGDRLERVQLCGLLAQIQGVLPVLLGLGYRHFTVDAAFIPHLAKRVTTISRADAERLASQVVAADTTQQVLHILQLTAERHSPFLR